MSALQIQSAVIANLEPALKLLAQSHPVAERQAAMERVRRVILSGELPMESLLTAQSEGRAVGVILSMLTAGRAGLIWPPQVETGPEISRVEDALTEKALEMLRGRGAKIAQALLQTNELAMGQSLLRNGFRHT